jgi:L-arabinose isomerase
VVDYFGINDLIQEVEKITPQEVDNLFQKYSTLYHFEYGNYSKTK